MATFGHDGSGTGNNYRSAENYIVGTKFTMPADGVAVSITAYIINSISNRKWKCAIYDASSIFVGETEEKTLSDGSLHWEIFNFPDPKPDLTANEEYYLVIYCESISGAGFIRSDDNNGFNVENDFDSYGPWPDPAVFANSYPEEKALIYCTYTQETTDIMTDSKILTIYALPPPPPPP